MIAKVIKCENLIVQFYICTSKAKPVLKIAALLSNIQA